MSITIHPAHLEEDVLLDVAADILPAAVQPVHQRRWVDDARGGHYEALDALETDTDGHVFYNVPVRAAKPDGIQISRVRLWLKSVSAIIPARVLLRPVGDVTVTVYTTGRGGMLIKCDGLEPVANSRNGANHE